MRTIKLLLLSPLFFYIFSCQREGFISDSGAKLSFSVDTVYFDTVFTTLSTVTRRFTVKNPYKEFIKISSATLAGGNASIYRINFDGVSGTEFRNIEIAPKDSLYMFVEATLDPNNSSGILLQQDSIVFITNQNVQDVDLVAWGQDVHIIRDSIFNTQTWTADKPYLVLGYAVLDSAQVLTIEPGTKIYFHRDSYLLIAGSLKVNGTKDNPVTFSGDRLEKLYDDVPGQWIGIILYPWSKDNYINYAEIKGGLVGIVVQSVFDNASRVDLSLQNTKIQHISSYGIRAANSTITGYNNLITNCGVSAIALEGGGYYEFNHITIANWFDYKNRNTPSLVFTNYVIIPDQQGKDSLIVVRGLESAYFGNSIIYGGNETEIAWGENTAEVMSFGFENCLIKFDTSDIKLKDNPHFLNCINYKDPLFLDIKRPAYNFHLDTAKVSPARDFGKYELGMSYPSDLDGVSRIADEKPDIGAYEFFPPK
jgi:hypothetical protein